MPFVAGYESEEILARAASPPAMLRDLAGRTYRVVDWNADMPLKGLVTLTAKLYVDFDREVKPPPVAREQVTVASSTR